MTDCKDISCGVTCDVIRDLMPLAADGVASEDSRALVMRHIAACEECEGIYRSMRKEKAVHTMEPANDKKIISLIRRRYLILIAFILCSGAVIGVVFTASEFMFQNILLMPAIGALSFVCFRYKGAWMAVVVILLSLLRGIVCLFTLEGETAFVEVMSCIPFGGIYAFFVILGWTAALLLSYAIKGKQKN